MASNRIGLTLAMLAIVAAIGCSDDDRQAADAEANNNAILNNTIESLRTELATAQSAATRRPVRVAESRFPMGA